MLNRRDSTLLEQRLFEKTNLEPDLHEKIEQIYMHYKMACMMFPCLPDAVFGMRYCKMILDNKKNQVPHYRSIAFHNKEKLTTYYLRRKSVLNYIDCVINNEIPPLS